MDERQRFFLLAIVLLLIGAFVTFGMLNYYSTHEKEIRRRMAARRRKRRVGRWRLALSFITHCRMQREIDRSEKAAARLSRDACAETLASFQDAFEAMGEEVPSVYNVTRKAIARQEKR